MAAKNGDLRFQSQLLALGKDADQQLSRMFVDAEKIRAAIDDVIRSYSKQEREEIRSQAKPSSALLDRTMREVIELSGYLFTNHPMVQSLPTFKELPHTLIFRIALCSYLSALDRGAHGGVTTARPDKLRNDLVDMNFVGFATYFDGVLSQDARLQRIYRKTLIWLSDLIRHCSKQ